MDIFNCSNFDSRTFYDFSHVCQEEGSNSPIKQMKIQTEGDPESREVMRRGRGRKEKREGGREQKREVGGKSRLQEWLESYGITRPTRDVKGAEGHIARLRGSAGEKEEVESRFKFTFKKVPREVEQQAERMRDTERDKKKEREELYKRMKGEEDDIAKAEEAREQERLPPRGEEKSKPAQGLSRGRGEPPHTYRGTYIYAEREKEKERRSSRNRDRWEE